MLSLSADIFYTKGFRLKLLVPYSGIFSDLIFEKFPEDGIKNFIESLSVKSYRQIEQAFTFFFLEH
jgi:hypothetical protein